MKDLSKIKAGDTLILRNGGREVCNSAGAMIRTHDHSWYVNGSYDDNGCSTSFDIIDYEPAPEKKEHSGSIVWLKFLEDGEIIARYCPNKAYIECPGGYEPIAITPVTFKEGDGL